MLATHVAAKKRRAGTSISVGTPPTPQTKPSHTTNIADDDDNADNNNNMNDVLGEIVKERQGGPTLSGAHSTLNTPFSTYGGSMSPPGRRSATPEGDEER